MTRVTGVRMLDWRRRLLMENWVLGLILVSCMKTSHQRQDLATPAPETNGWVMS